ncbi:MAG: heme NO-binding domain-containing protein [Polyangiales bacterium]
MKGVVFTEFLELVDARFGADMTESLVDGCELPSGGAYTAVGTYDHHEILTLVTALSARTGAPVAALVKAFGHHLAGAFAKRYGAFFARAGGTFPMLRSVDEHIHVEVRKLYPDAELPRFDVEHHDDTRMVLVYRSSRPFADLAEGLIEATAAHFGDTITLQRSEIETSEGTAVRFEITREARAAA